ncbi:AAA domain-containing protein [Dialister sp.]|uniref:AAA domain-containing protein n=1 Tax=Dialister sp. TaxID=1955814 RepID=UPI002E81424B|nr:AAA domain-containing protein [Dialister sp.]MEE3453303.1 AAA domain-containing protein [Dialister sp.]
MNSPSDRKRVELLFRTIQQIHSINKEVIKNFRSYAQCFVLSELMALDPDEEYIRYEGCVETNRILSVKKPEIPSCPPFDPILKGWLPGYWDDPYRKDVPHFTNKDYYGEGFEQSPARETAYQKWVIQRNQWLEKCRPLIKIDTIFTSMYELIRQFRQDPEDQELLFTFGLFKDVRRNTINPVNHPVFTKRIKIDDDDIKNNIISFYDTDAEVKMESGFFEGLPIGSIPQVSADMENCADSPYDHVKMREFLRQEIHLLSRKAEYVEPDEPKNTFHDFEISYSPVFIVRKRKSGLDDFVKKIISDINDPNFELPHHLVELMHPQNHETDTREEESVDSIEKRLAATSGEDPDIFMTKPANKEQLLIARKIEHTDAVEVQGPPGTGKTHTIANLIGHFLAQGKSILVTSEKVKALTVLKDKLDDDIKPLCVPVFQDNFDELQYSIKSILSKLGTLNAADLANQIEGLRRQRKQLIQDMNEERKKIFMIRNQESKGIVYSGEDCSVIEAAKFVNENSSELDKIPGSIGDLDSLPLDEEEIRKLYRSNKLFTPDEEAELELGLPPFKQFIKPEAFKNAEDHIRSAKRQADVLKENDISFYREDIERNVIYADNWDIISSPDKEALEKVKDLLEKGSNPTPLQRAVIQAAAIGENGAALWEDFAKQIDVFIDVDTEYRSLTRGEKVKFNLHMHPAKLREALSALLYEFTYSGSIGFFFKLTHGDAATALSGITIDSHEMMSAEDAKMAQAALDWDLKQKALQYTWNQCVPNFPGEMMPFESIPEIQRAVVLNETKKRIQDALDWKTEWHENLMTLLEKSGFNRQYIERQVDFGTRFPSYLTFLHTKLLALVRLAELYLDNRQVIMEIRKAGEIFRTGALSKSILGSELNKALYNHDCSAYEEAYQKYIGVYNKIPEYEERKELLEELGKYAPAWADAIRGREGIHGNPEPPENLELAWKTKRLNDILDDIFAESVEERQQKVEQGSIELRDKTGQLANRLAWMYLWKKLQGKKQIQSNLQSWLSLMKKRGKGTGKYAEKYEKDAMKCMLEGQKAVPAWIVPVKRVLENFDPMRNHFDIAIVDEASQSSLEALAITVLADKIIVVGDDKQVSPMSVGTDIEKVQNILKQNLAEFLNNWQLFDGRTSFYELEGTVFTPIMLREHFRCVPEIIGYCNEKFYHDEILPLRDSNSSKLLPPVVNYRVQGEREGRNKTNYIEAETIASLILACWEEPEYKGKTFGVISLLGDDQGPLISNIVMRHFNNLETLKEREFICGNAASFQGDERDVIFLSMVDDDTSSRKVTTDDAKKRYNVAVSRAKDQLWLVHSLDMTQLQKDDLKYGLLEYVQNYKDHTRRMDRVKELADSPFEIEVASFLLTNGYNIQQQYAVGAYRIDMVVFYKDKKIALECDGERYHSSESQIENDMERQCILERLGWNFIRIRGGEYYRDKEKTLEKLRRELGRNGIEPEQKETEIQINAETGLLERVKHRAEKLREEWAEAKEENPAGNANPSTGRKKPSTGGRKRPSPAASPKTPPFREPDLFVGIQTPEPSRPSEEKPKPSKRSVRKSPGANGESKTESKTGHPAKGKVWEGSFEVHPVKAPPAGNGKTGAIQLGDLILLQNLKSGQNIPYQMVKRPNGQLTDSAKACLGHGLNDIVQWSGMTYKIVQITPPEVKKVEPNSAPIPFKNDGIRRVRLGDVVTALNITTNQREKFIMGKKANGELVESATVFLNHARGEKVRFHNKNYQIISMK